jgi:hypothetical protein
MLRLKRSFAMLTVAPRPLLLGRVGHYESG